jgi:drug/metabolite transporter (DMT)-like permease
MLVLVLAALFLGERVTRRRLVGFAIAFVGMVLISLAKQGTGAAAYPILVAITALAPLCWSVYSVISKPLAGQVPPIVWTYLTITVGGLMTFAAVPTSAWARVAALDGRGWGGVLYLSVPCTVLGYALWNWLLRFLPASTVGFTVFLNPPLTTASKWILAAALPATFAFTIGPMEWIGGAVTLTGLAIAVRETGR